MWLSKLDPIGLTGPHNLNKHTHKKNKKKTFCRVDSSCSSTSTLWTSLFPVALGLFKLHVLLCFIEILVVNAKNVDPYQMLHSTVSGLGLHCLPVTLCGVSRLNLVNPL